MALKFPFWTPRSDPTPPTGMVCRKCQAVEWTLGTSNRVYYHSCGARLSTLTAAESEQLKAHVAASRMKGLHF